MEHRAAGRHFQCAGAIGGAGEAQHTDDDERAQRDHRYEPVVSGPPGDRRAGDLEDVDVVDRHRAEAARLQDRHLVVVQVDPLRRVLDDRRRVRRHDVLVLAHADDQGRPLPRHHHRFRLVLADHRDPVRPLDLVQRDLDDAVEELDPLSFLLGRLLDQICARLAARSLAAALVAAPWLRPGAGPTRAAA